jgi:hypothetical protein
MYEVFQTSDQPICAELTAPNSGAFPGSLLVAVTGAAPHLVVSRG